MARFVFITGGVVSSLGKGIAAAALGALLQARGYAVKLRKLDPYLNVDPGTMSPTQHGEVFVTDDGAETDLDLGHYERFTGVHATRLLAWRGLGPAPASEILLQALPYDRGRLLQRQLAGRGQEAPQPIHRAQGSLVSPGHLGGNAFGLVCIQPALQPVQQGPEVGPTRVSAH